MISYQNRSGNNGSPQTAQARVSHDRLQAAITRLERERRKLAELIRNSRLEIGHDIEALDEQVLQVEIMLTQLGTLAPPSCYRWRAEP